MNYGNVTCDWDVRPGVDDFGNTLHPFDELKSIRCGLWGWCRTVAEAWMTQLDQRGDAMTYIVVAGRYEPDGEENCKYISEPFATRELAEQHAAASGANAYPFCRIEEVQA